MEIMAKIEEGNRLQGHVAEAMTKLKAFASSTEKSDEGYLSNIRDLERAVYVAHSKWQVFAEKNFWAG